MSPMDREAIGEALSAAVARAADGEFERLRAATDDVGHRVECALRGLRDPAQRSLLDSRVTEVPAAIAAAGRGGHIDVTAKPAREILVRATGFMDAYDFTLNPYAGCAFGCTYCYAACFSRSVERREAWGL